MKCIMNTRAATVFAICLFLFTTGCLDALTNSNDSSKFWGDDCEDVSEEICPSGKAPDFALVDQNGNPVNLGSISTSSSTGSSSVSFFFVAMGS